MLKNVLRVSAIDTERGRNAEYWYARRWSEIYATLNPRTAFAITFVRSCSKWHIFVKSGSCCVRTSECLKAHTLIRAQNIMLIWTLNNKYCEEECTKDAPGIFRRVFFLLSFIVFTLCCRRRRFHCHCLLLLLLFRSLWLKSETNKIRTFRTFARSPVEIWWNYS